MNRSPEKVTFPVTSKPPPPTVFNLLALDWVHCEEETGAYTQLSCNTAIPRLRQLIGVAKPSLCEFVLIGVPNAC